MDDKEKSLIYGSGLFFFKSTIPDNKKLEIIKWFDSLPEEHKEFIDTLISEAVEENEFFNTGY